MRSLPWATGTHPDRDHIRGSCKAHLRLCPTEGEEAGYLSTSSCHLSVLRAALGVLTLWHFWPVLSPSWAHSQDKRVAYMGSLQVTSEGAERTWVGPWQFLLWEPTGGLGWVIKLLDSGGGHEMLCTPGFTSLFQSCSLFLMEQEKVRLSKVSSFPLSHSEHLSQNKAKQNMYIVWLVLTRVNVCVNVHVYTHINGRVCMCTSYVFKYL